MENHGPLSHAAERKVHNFGSFVKYLDLSGADPGFRRGGGGSYIQKGGGVRTGISGADPSCCRVLGKSTSKKKLQTAVGGGDSDHPKKHLYPRMPLTQWLTKKVHNFGCFVKYLEVQTTPFRKRSKILYFF